LVSSGSINESRENIIASGNVICPTAREIFSGCLLFDGRELHKGCQRGTERIRAHAHFEMARRAINPADSANSEQADELIVEALGSCHVDEEQTRGRSSIYRACASFKLLQAKVRRTRRKKALTTKANMVGNERASTFP
jgi:hypothetical protein